MSKNLSPAVTLTPEQDEQRRLAAAEELLEREKSQAQIAGDHSVTRAAVPQWKQTRVEEGIERLKSTTDEGVELRGGCPLIDYRHDDRQNAVEGVHVREGSGEMTTLEADIIDDASVVFESVGRYPIPSSRRYR